MTALDALRNPAVRDQIADIQHGRIASDATIKRFLDGYPPGRDRLAEALRERAVAAGVDLETIPHRTPEEVAQKRRDLAPKCKRCREQDEPRVARLVESVQAERARVAELEARVAELEAQLAAAERAGHRTVAAIDAQDAAARQRVATPAPIPIRRDVKPQKQPVVKLEGFPDDEPAVAT